MTVYDDLMDRNARFAAAFDRADMPMLPTLRTLVVTCVDARVDPAHVLGLKLGEALVMRNNGGRISRAVIDEIVALTAMVSAATGGGQAAFNVILMQHTNCGAERLADPQLQARLRDDLGIDVAEYAITDQPTDLMQDIGRLAAETRIPDEMAVAAMLYDVTDGTVQEIAPVKCLGDHRAILANASD